MNTDKDLEQIKIRLLKDYNWEKTQEIMSKIREALSLLNSDQNPERNK